jgi:hypothetical protein
MIVNDFRVVRAVFTPLEADPPLLVDPNAVLPLSITTQNLQTIAWQTGQVFQAGCAIKSLEPALRLSCKTLESANPTTEVMRFSVLVAKTSDHVYSPSTQLCVTSNITQEVESRQPLFWDLNLGVLGEGDAVGQGVVAAAGELVDGEAWCS